MMIDLNLFTSVCGENQNRRILFKNYVNFCIIKIHTYHVNKKIWEICILEYNMFGLGFNKRCLEFKNYCQLFTKLKIICVLNINKNKWIHT